MQIVTVAPSAHPVFMVTPEFKGPVGFEMTLHGDVDGVHFANISTQETTTVVWQQDSVGYHKVSYGPMVDNACAVIQVPGAVTIQHLVVGERMDVLGVGCETPSWHPPMPIYFTLQTFSLVATAIMLAMVLLSWRRLRA